MLRSICIKRKYREKRQHVNALLSTSHYQLSKINIWEEIYNLIEVLTEIWEIWKHGFIKNLREFELLRVKQGHIQDGICGKEEKSQQLKEVSKGSVTKAAIRMYEVQNGFQTLAFLLLLVQFAIFSICLLVNWVFLSVNFLFITFIHF